MHFKAIIWADLSIFIAVSLPAIVFCLIRSQENAPIEQTDSFDANKLFDYEGYKKTFGKDYSSNLEDSRRRVYFYARAMAVFVSGVNYKFRAINHYNALNDMSDWLPSERTKLRNKRRHAMTTRSMARLEAGASKPLLFMSAKGEDPEETLRKFLETRSADPKYRDVLNEWHFDHYTISKETKRRAKRHVPSDRNQKPRNFSFNKLIHGASDETAEVKFKPEVPLEDRNPDYLGIETNTRGIGNQLEEVEFKIVGGELDEGDAGQELSSLDSQLESALNKLEIATKDEPSGQNTAEEDKIFIDHSQLGCMSPIRQQGQCGSCYAFASVAIIEWLYCKKKGLLVEFSEQYMVDCGNKRIGDMYGCDGASDSAVANFVHNFGVELRQNYPYQGQEQTCPYDDSTDLSTTGYIRVELGAYAGIPISLWAETLEELPLYVVIQLYDEFYDYGGGLYDGAQCQDDPDTEGDYHAVVLVGHGREDGQEYWLIRNSHGRRWGESGYFKLSKTAPASCILDQVAYALGSKDGLKIDARPHKNRRHNEEIIATGGLGRGRRRRKN